MSSAVAQYMHPVWKLLVCIVLVLYPIGLLLLHHNAAEDDMTAQIRLQWVQEGSE